MKTKLLFLAVLLCSALAPASNTTVMQDYRQVLMLNFNVNLDFGAKHRECWQRIENEDTESDILSRY